MKIKNAKEYRDWYKKNIRKTKDENRKTNFIGSYDEKNDSFGFFDIYHGDKKDIKNFLISTLQNAEDEQSIYEFIQNASDCGSSDFILIYNKQNFLVINNGEPFYDDNIRSILNVDQSTKFERQGESYKSVIGKYGLGFKLAHRLVGKNEGADELLGEKNGKYTGNHKGPILFSWYNKTQFENLIQNKEELIPETNFIENSKDAPWLIKIILTCFPTHPNESNLTNLKFEENQILFNNNELQNFHTFIDKNKKFINSITHDKGSMFYIELGDDVYDKLLKTDNNIRTGIQFSLNLLANNLKSIYINGNDDSLNFENKKIEIKPLEKLKHVISKQDNLELFNEINPEYKNEDIELIFGYPKHNEDEKAFLNEITELKKSANLYQYFPLGGELHNLAFIIHSNAFARQSNRKFLEKDVSKNETLFNTLVEKLKNDLNNYKTENLKQFKQIFEVILLSDRSTGVHKELVNTFLYEPLNNYLKENCPTKNKKYFGSKTDIKIKGSKLDINLEKFGINQYWFDWDYFKHKEICKKAKDNAKTGIKVWYIGDILKEVNLENIENINKWIIDLDKQGNYDVFLNELNNIGNRNNEEEREKGDIIALSDIQILKKIAFLKFIDKNGEVYFKSIDEINTDNSYIFINHFTKSVSEILKKLGFKISAFSTSLFNKYIKETNKSQKSNFESFLKENIKHLKYIYSNIDDSYFQRISEKTKANTLTQDERKQLFINQKPICDKINWELFENKNGVVPLKQLLKPNQQIKWLQSYEINQPIFNEINEILEQNQDYIYSNIIEPIPFWNDIIKQDFVKNDIENFYKSIITFYENDKSENKIFLSQEDNRKIFYNNEDFVTINNVFVPKKVKENIDFNVNLLDFRQALITLKNFYVLDFNLVQLIEKDPFNFTSDNLVCLDNFEDKNLNQKEIQAIIDYAIYNDENLFKTLQIIKDKDDNYNIFPHIKNFVQYSTENTFLIDYLNDNKVEYHLLPNEFYKDSLIDIGLLNGAKLYKKILNDSDDLIKPISKCKYPDIIKEYLLHFYQELNINTSHRYNNDSNEYLVLKLVTETLKESDEIEKFREKILIDNTQITRLTASNTVTIQNVKLQLSKILESYTEAGKVDKLITDFVDLQKLDKIFGIDEPRTPQEVYHDMPERMLLNSAHKFVFAILYAKENNDLSLLNKFEIELFDTSKGQKNLFEVFKNDLLFTENFDFIDTDCILNDTINSQNECNTLLNENPEFTSNSFLKISYNQEEKIVIAKEPFISNSEFYCGKLIAFIDIRQKISFLNFFLKEWNKLKIEKLKIRNYNINYIIGDVLEEKVYLNIFALDSELLKGNIYDENSYDSIQNKDQLIQFFSAFGLNNENSAIVKLRKKFLNVETDIDISSLYKINKTLLNNTLLWIANNDKVEILYNDDSLKNTLRNIYKEVKQFETPLPIVKFDTDLKIQLLSNTDNIKAFNIDLIEELNNFNISKENFISKTQDFYNLVVDEISDDESIDTIILEPILNTEKLKLGKEFDQFSEFGNTRFYKKWKNRYDYEIFIVDFPIPYGIYIEDDANDNILISENWENGNHKVNDKKIFIFIDGDKNFENLMTVLKEIDDIQNIINDFKTLKNEYEPDTPADDADIEKAKKRLFNYNSYTFEWQKAMIEYEHETQKKHIYKKEIVFSQIDRSGQILNLSNPNVEQLPFTLTFYVNEEGKSVIPIKLYYDNNIQNANAQILVVDEFEMQIEIEDSFNLEQITANIKQVKIILPPNTFLFDKLNQAIGIFPNEGNMKDYFVENYKQQKLKFVFGPPGTGKTLFIAGKILQFLSENTSCKIGIFTPTNKSADVVLEQVLDIIEGKFDISKIDSQYFSKQDISIIQKHITNLHNDLENKFIRFGNTYNQEQLEKYVKTRHSEYVELQSFVLISTIHRTTFDIFNELALSDYPFDIIFLDESSMIPLPYSTFIIESYKESKEIYIAGDPFQIHPVGLTPTFPDLFESKEYKGWNTENIYTLTELESFEQNKTKIGEFEIIKLLKQFRSVPSIGATVSNYLYNNLVSSSRTETNEILSIENIDFKPISIIDFKITQTDNKEYASLELFDIFQFNNFGQKSFYNPYSAILSAELALLLEKQYPEKSIGIISPYRIQVSIINKIIRAYKSKISVGTVHGFQGDARDIIIFVVNPNNINASDLAFINNKNILNVGISRAKDFLFIIKPSNMKNDFEMNNIINLANQNDKIIYTNTDYEKKLLKENTINDRTELFDFQRLFLYSSELEKTLQPKYELYISDNSLHIAMK